MSRIAFDVSQAGSGKAGCGYYASALIASLLQGTESLQFHLLSSWGDFFHDPEMALASPYHGKNVTYGPRFTKQSDASSHWNNPETIRQSLTDCDLLHINNFWHPPFRLDLPVVYTIYDLSFAEHPEWTTEANRLGCFTGMQNAAAYADYFVAISESSKQVFLRHFPHVDEERVRVIYPASRFQIAVDDVKMQKPSRLRIAPNQPFLLSVSTIEPRKNQRFLLEVYKIFRNLCPISLPLVLVGGQGWMMEEFDSLISQHPYREGIIKLGYVSDCEVAWLYQHCMVTLYPSLYEGFGLPLLEAMGFGAPVISSNSTSMPEIVADAAPALDPYDAQAWCDVLLGIIQQPDLRNRLAQASSQRATLFDWSTSCGQLQEYYFGCMRA